MNKKSAIRRHVQTNIVARIIYRLICIALIVAGIFGLFMSFSASEQSYRYTLRDETTTATVTKKTKETDEYGYVEVILYSEKEAGTYAFSLYVASSEDVEAATENPDALADIDAGTYISSEYVQTAFDEKSVVELSGKYSLRDSEKKEIAAEDLNARVEWARLLREESTKVDFFDGYSLYINLDGENYYTIEEAAKIIGAEAEDLTPKYAAGTPVYDFIGNVTAAEIPSYFKIADAEGHAGKTRRGRLQERLSPRRLSEDHRAG